MSGSLSSLSAINEAVLNTGEPQPYRSPSPDKFLDGFVHGGQAAPVDSSPRPSMPSRASLTHSGDLRPRLQGSLDDMRRLTPDLPDPKVPSTLGPALQKFSKTNRVVFDWPPVDVAKTLNFIWMGKPITQRLIEMDNLKRWRSKCRGLTLTLFVDAEQAKSPAVQKFCRSQKIFLVNMDVVAKNMPYNLGEGMDFAKGQLPPNYGMMSDLLRYPMAYYFGSYADVGDVAPEENHAMFPLFFGDQTPPDLILNLSDTGNDRLGVSSLGVPALQVICQAIEKKLRNLKDVEVPGQQQHSFSFFPRLTLALTGPYLLREIAWADGDVNKINAPTYSGMTWISEDAKRRYLDAWVPGDANDIAQMQDRVENYILTSFDLNYKINMRIYDYFLSKLPATQYSPEQKEAMKQACLNKVLSAIAQCDVLPSERSMWIDACDLQVFEQLREACKARNVAVGIGYAFQKAFKYGDIPLLAHLSAQYPNEASGFSSRIDGRLMNSRVLFFQSYYRYGELSLGEMKSLVYLWGSGEISDQAILRDLQRSLGTSVDLVEFLIQTKIEIEKLETKSYIKKSQCSLL